ncbi:MAG: SusD/RagB family nutrient-binding outer membrane lipoprotein [Muribaculaceae bacterium]
MKKFNLNKILSRASILAAVVMMSTACTAGFEEANRPGESVSSEELSRDNYNTGSFLVQMLNEAFPEQENSYQMNQDLIGNYLGRYMTYANNAFSGNNFAKMNAPVGWVRYPFADSMPKTVSAFNEVKRLTGTESLSYAWALILRAQSFLRLTDMYGPMPIGAEADANAYSSQEKIYHSLVDDLNTAVNIISGMISANGGQLVQFKESDKVYSGNFVQWVKFANSLKLRMAVRMRFVDPAYAQQVGEEAVAAGVIESNADNCAITYTPNGQYKTSVEWGDSRACADIDSYMTGYNDPRITKYFTTPASAGSRSVIGCRAGANIGNKSVADAVYSAANVESDTRGLWMSAAEVTFCRAEGALAGWAGMGGTTESLYAKAITLSFEQWGASGAEQYINNADATPADYTDADGGYGSAHAKMSTITIKWDESASDEEKLERLIVQKWIALFPDGQEAWNEIRRTGYPKVFPVAQSTAYSIDVPNRIPFDYTEPVNNPANYAEALRLLGGNDDYATKMWWQR